MWSWVGILLILVSCCNVQGWACSGSSSPWLPRAVCLKPRPSTDCTFTWVVRELRHVYVHECLVKWMRWTRTSLFKHLSLDYCNIYVAKWLIIDSILILNHVLKWVSVMVNILTSSNVVHAFFLALTFIKWIQFAFSYLIWRINCGKITWIFHFKPFWTLYSEQV